MIRYFIPYSDGSPAIVEIKGHKMLLVSSQEEDLDSLLDAAGADEYVEMDMPETDQTEEEALASITDSFDTEKNFTGVVIAPPGVPADHLLYELQDQLPWIH